VTMNQDQAEEKEKDAERVLLSKERLAELSSRLLKSQEEERKRIAHEVHENLAQDLMAVQFRVEAALSEEEWAANPKLRAFLEPVGDILQDGLGNIRRIAGRLRPLILDDLGILVTVSRFCRQIAEEHPGLEIAQKLEIEEQEVPESLKLVIYRILENAMCVIVKSKPYSDVEVSLGRKGHSISLTIRNRAAGLGLAQSLCGDESHGWSDAATIEERVMISGGSIATFSENGGGTTLQVTWPVEGPGSRVQGPGSKVR
jgi:signal transduction histidine kinase